jgi:protein-tyrosine phosphatase
MYCNRSYLARMFPGESKFQPFLDRDVADPWYSGDFTATWRDLVEGCKNILQEVKK